MSVVLDMFRGMPEVSVGQGEILIEEGQKLGKLFVLVEGEVAVLKKDIEINNVWTPGSVFGEVSVLLDIPHMATVKALCPSRFRVAENARVFLQAHPEINLHLATLLARRLNSLTHYLVDLKRQFEGNKDHLGMVDEVLDGLRHQQYGDK